MVCVAESLAVKVPDDVDPAVLVSVIFPYMTAYQPIHRAAKARPVATNSSMSGLKVTGCSDYLLVSGDQSGVGGLIDASLLVSADEVAASHCSRDALAVVNTGDQGPVEQQIQPRYVSRAVSNTVASTSATESGTS